MYKMRSVHAVNITKHLDTEFQEGIFNQSFWRTLSYMIRNYTQWFSYRKKLNFIFKSDFIDLGYEQLLNMYSICS